VVVIDGNTNQVVTDISLNQSCGLGTQGIAVNQFTNRVYVSDYDDSQEVVIDGATNEIAARVDLLGGLPVGVAVDLISNKEWVTLDGPLGKIDILDGATNTISSSFSVGNAFINNLAINPSTRRVYIASTDTPSGIYVLNADTLQTLTKVPTGLFANDVSLNQLTNTVFVTDGQGNQLFVVAGNTNKVVATVPLFGSGPTGVASNPVTRSVYVTDFGSAEVEIVR
jgi:YVTN family beta-propeller protein